MTVGYTHSWYRPVRLDGKKFEAAVRDFALLGRVLESAGVELSGPGGSGTAILSRRVLAFNGKPGHCEDFEISVEDRAERTVRNGLVFGFCKTNRARYDLAVMVALLILKHHLGDDLKVSTDGDNGAWQGAWLMVERELNYGSSWEVLTRPAPPPDEGFSETVVLETRAEAKPA